MTYLEALKEKFPDCKDRSRTIEKGKCVEYRHPPICRAHVFGKEHLRCTAVFDYGQRVQASAEYCELCWNEEIKENEGSVTVDSKIGWCRNTLEEKK